MLHIEALTRSTIDIVITDHKYEDDLISIASIRNFKINSDGSWVALIEGKICAARRYYEKTHIQQLTQHHTVTTQKIYLDQVNNLPAGTLKDVIKNLVVSTVTPTYYLIDT